ncbi:MAG: hypothetical protein ACJ8GW_03530 [Massilia sp.]
MDTLYYEKVGKYIFGLQRFNGFLESLIHWMEEGKPRPNSGESAAGLSEQLATLNGYMAAHPEHLSVKIPLAEILQRHATCMAETPNLVHWNSTRLEEQRAEVLAIYATLSELVDVLGCPTVRPESLREPNIRL